MCRLLNVFKVPKSNTFSLEFDFISKNLRLKKNNNKKKKNSLDDYKIFKYIKLNKGSILKLKIQTLDRGSLIPADSK